MMLTGIEGETTPAIGPTAAWWWQGSKAISPLAQSFSAASASCAQPSSSAAPIIAPLSGPDILSQAMGGPACRRVRSPMPGISSMATPMSTHTGLAA